MVGEFSRGFSEYINDPVRFRTSLVATKIREGANVMYISTEITLIYSLMLLHSDSFFYRSRFGGLDSLVHLLLGVTAIQPKVARILLEKLPEYIDDGGME